jgi:multidrug efflux system membrane fusion protein
MLRAVDPRNPAGHPCNGTATQAGPRLPFAPIHSIHFFAIQGASVPFSDKPGRPRGRPLLAVFWCGAALCALAGCDAVKSRADRSGDHAAVPAVGVAPVVVRNIVEKQEFSGRLDAIDHVEVRARVPGYVTELHVEAGQVVKQGQLLFVIDPRPYQADLNRARANLEGARARAELAAIELARAEKLLADKAIAQRELDERASAWKETSANVHAAMAALEQARLNLEYTRVVAPIAGRVSKEEVTLGNLITSAQVLTSIVSMQRIYASFEGDEATYLRVAAAARGAAPVPVRVGLANEHGFPHAGRLQFVDNRLDARAGSIRMRAILDNADGTLVPGLFARVQLPVGGDAAANRAVLVDDAAIGTDQDRKFVYVVGAANKAEYRAVTLGQMDDGLRVVRTGLRPGEQVVVSGLQRVHPGDGIAPQPVPMGGAAKDKS